MGCAGVRRAVGAAALVSLAAVVGCAAASTDIDTAGPGSSAAASVTAAHAGATVSPTVLEADRAFCEALADWINTANAHASKDDFGYGTIDPPTMSSLIADFAEIIELAPGELHQDMQLLVDRAVSDLYADDVQAANRRLEAWAVLHCRFAMDGANLQGDPGTTQPAGVTVGTSGVPPGTSGAVGTDSWPPGSAPVISAR